MGQALYRKYRPKSLNDVVGQEHITTTLQQAIAGGRLSHAYLLTGPKGIGKTSVARILAHVVNELPYTDDATHIDIIEIDAASNRRIDEIRELRDKVYVAPTSAKYKVYIIDEVHMLTREAFNALLKTLEEPPAHVIFILATTDAHKLPETIISRTQRFSFKPVPAADVAAHLKSIAGKEGLQVDDEALLLLAEHGGGSFRDSISLLDQAGGQGQTISKADVEKLLGVPSAEGITGLAAVMQDTMQPLAARAQVLNQLLEQGYQANALAAALGQALRRQLISGEAPLPEATVKALEQLIEVPVAHDPERYLELVVLGGWPSGTQAGAPISAPTIPISAPPKPVAAPDVALSAPKPAPKPEPEPAKVAESSPESAKAKKPADEPKTTKQESPKKAKKAKPVDGSIIDNWQEVLGALKVKYNTLYGVVRMAEPRLTDEGGLELAFAFAFHQKRLTDTKHRQILSTTIHDVTGQSPEITCIVDKNAKPPQPGVPAVKPAELAPESVKTAAAKPPTEAMTNVSNIFGGGELLES